MSESKNPSRDKPGTPEKAPRKPAAQRPHDYVTITVPELPHHGEAES